MPPRTRLPVTHRHRLQLVTKPKNKKFTKFPARTILRRKRMRLSQSIPPILEQSPSYKRSEFRLGFPEVHCLGAVDGFKLNYGIDSRHTWGESTNLARVEVKTSGIEGAGNGLFAAQDLTKIQVFTGYYGTIISETEAAELELQVLPFDYCSRFCCK